MEIFSKHSVPKRVQTEYGPVEVETPRDRDGTFTPETIRKRETILAEDLSDKIISLYATGQSVCDISRSVKYSPIRHPCLWTTCWLLGRHLLVVDSRLLLSAITLEKVPAAG